MKSKANTTVFERGRWRSAMHDETGVPLFTGRIEDPRG